MDERFTFCRDHSWNVMNRLGGLAGTSLEGIFRSKAMPDTAVEPSQGRTV